MPVYEYECPKCDSKFEVTRKFSETGGNSCPSCGAEGRRVYCAPFLVFKGPGFYVTDSRTEVDPELEHRKKEKEAAEKAEKGETTSEAKKPEQAPAIKSKVENPESPSKK
ncbi:MAG: FmdB family zinc ribbon protein [Dehalogenimonas sp.]